MPSFYPYRRQLRRKANIFCLERYPEIKNIIWRLFGFVVRSSRLLSVCDVITLAESPRRQSCWSCHSRVARVEFSHWNYDAISATLRFSTLESYSELLELNEKKFHPYKSDIESTSPRFSYERTGRVALPPQLLHPNFISPCCRCYIRFRLSQHASIKS